MGAAQPRKANLKEGAYTKEGVFRRCDLSTSAEKDRCSHLSRLVEAFFDTFELAR